MQLACLVDLLQLRGAREHRRRSRLRVSGRGVHAQFPQGRSGGWPPRRAWLRYASRSLLYAWPGGVSTHVRVDRHRGSWDAGVNTHGLTATFGLVLVLEPAESAEKVAKHALTTSTLLLGNSSASEASALVVVGQEDGNGMIDMKEGRQLFSKEEGVLCWL